MFLQAAHNTSLSAYLAVQPFEDVVRPDIAPVLAGELEVRQRFANTPRSCRTPSGSGCSPSRRLRGSPTYIPVGEVHRLQNEGKLPLVIVEVQVGEYTGEDDIIRVEDDFHRK